MKWILFLSSFLACSFSTLAACTKDMPIEGMAVCTYNKFTVWLSCKDNIALLSFTETLSKDAGHEDTSNRNYFLDPSPAILDCQQTSDSTYASTKSGYDVGHLTAIDHFDNNIVDALQTNAMTNMIPRATKFNRNGAWKRTETLVECFRDDSEFLYGENVQVGASVASARISVYTGVIIGNQLDNDFYEQSHGLRRTPDYLWKLIYSPLSNQYDAWIMRNSDSSNVASLKHSRKSLQTLIKTLEEQPGEDSQLYVPVTEKLKTLLARTPSQIELKYSGKCHARRG